MSGIITYIMVIVMAFSSIGGMTANVEDTVSFETKISMDAETVLAMAGAGTGGATEETQQIMKAVGDILDVLTLKGTATKDTAELAILAKEDAVLSLGVKTTEEGATFASSLLGSQTIFFSSALLEQMQQSMTTQGASSGVDTAALEQLQNLDREQIKKDAAEMGEKLTQAIEAKKGETEAGEFAVDGMAFTGRTPVNMTYDELMELILTGTKELMEKDSMKPIAQMNGQDFGAQIDKALEDIKNLAEEDKPVLTMTAYTDADNCSYYVCDMIRAAKEEAAEEQMYIAIGNVDGLSRARFNGNFDDTKMDIVSTGTKEGAFDMKATIESRTGNGEINAAGDGTGTIDLVADIKSGETNAKIVLKTEPAEDGRTAFSFELFMGGADKALLALTGTAGKGGELLSAFEGDSITAVPVEQLMSEESTASKQIAMTLTASLLKAVTNLTKNLPEDSAAWLNSQIMQVMTPKTTAEPAAEEAAPAE